MPQMGQNVFWNGNSWVDANGASTGTADGGGKYGDNYFGSDRNDQSRHWVRARTGVSQLLYDYLTRDYGQARQNQDTRQGLYNQYVQNLDSTQGAERSYQRMMGTSADAGGNAAASAIALGMDPRANALQARNQAGVAANDAAQAAYDPAAHAAQLQNAIGLAGQVSQPVYSDMLQQMMGYDVANNGPWVQQQMQREQSGGGFGSILGGLFGAAGSAGGFGKLFR